jgi:hypothetical protein
MAQIVRLRRSSVIGKKPTNAQLELGELSINTSDGKVFLAKSGSGGPSIEELISTNTVNTGSINLIGNVTASNFSGSFIGNGSGITNVVSSSYAVTSSYAGLAFTIESTPGATQLLTVSTPSTTWTFNHNLGEQFPVIQVYDDNGFVVIPTSIEMFSDITTIITFSLAQSGYATATVGGGLPAISSSYVGSVLQTDGVGASWEPIGSLSNYGQFSDTTIQNGSGTSSTAHAMRFNTIDLASGFSIVSGTRITAANSGTYNLQFSAQLLQPTNNAADISIWLSKNGTNVPNSNTDLTIEKVSGGGKLVAAWNYIVQLNPTEYVELMWSSTRSDTQIHYQGIQSSPSRPATPSIIVTMTQII